MRILFVHNYYQQRGGEDGVFQQEVSSLRENGHAVETVEFTNERFDGSLIGNLLGAVKSLYNSQSARRVEQAIDTFQPDIVHIHNLFYEASPSVIRAAKRRGIPVVMTLHNYRLVCNSGMLSRAEQVPCERCLTKTIPLAGVRYGCFRDSRIQSTQLTAITSLHKLTGLWRSVDRYIVLTEFARKKILESSLNLRPEQVVVKPNAVPDLGYSGPEQREDFFLYIGRLSFEKGIKVLLEAAKSQTFELVIAGDGPFREEVEQVANQYTNVTYVGKLDRQAGIDMMKRAKAILVPSIWYEGLPTTILEAFSTGTPIICSDQENLEEIIGSDETGLFFKTGNSTSLVNTILLAIKMIDKYMHESARTKYKKKYNDERLLKVIVNLYDKVLTDYCYH